MFFWCLQFPPKNERKQVDLTYHSSKVEFVCSLFGRSVGLKKSFRLCLTFRMPNLKFKSWTGYDNLDFNKLCQKVISIFLECSKAKVAKSIWMHILNIHASKRHTYSPKGRFSTLISNLIKDPKSIQVSQLSAAMMSWVGCLLKDSELFLLFAENSQILLEMRWCKPWNIFRALYLFQLSRQGGRVF